LKNSAGRVAGFLVGSTGIQVDRNLSAVVEWQQIDQKLLAESERIAEGTDEELGDLALLVINVEGFAARLEQCLTVVSADGDNQSVRLELEEVLVGIAD